jgi:hypothetical protein
VRRAVAAILLLGAGACRGAGDGARAGPAPSASALRVEAAAEEAPAGADAGAQLHGAARAAAERVAIPAGKLVLGSTPGDRGRDPALEPAAAEVDLGAFAIDRLPFPNDPRRPPLTGVPRARAVELCAERGGRLCGELEWERACKGPAQQAYAGGETWAEGCARAPETCASGFGVLALGAAMREWTASDVAPIQGILPRAVAAVRGARHDAADVDHRCARRSAVPPDAAFEDLGFRCCYGAATGAPIPAPEWLPAFRKAELSPASLREMLGAVPRLRALAASEPKYFREESAVETVLRRAATRGSAAPDAGVPPADRWTTAPLRWSPMAGEELLIVTAQAGEHSFVVALHALAGDRWRLGASLVLENELGPIVLVFDPEVRRKLAWSMCWQCFAEGGTIAYRDDNRVVITHE